jgi:hypothetical protein
MHTYGSLCVRKEVTLMASLKEFFGAGKAQYVSPLVIDLGDITKITLGDPTSELDANV